MKAFGMKQEVLENDLKELKQSIFPRYQEIAENIRNVKKNDLEKNILTLTEAVNKLGEDWHKEIDIIIDRKKSEIKKMETEHLSFLKQEGDAIECSITKITRTISDLEHLLESEDIYLISSYISINDEFRKLPPQLTLPSFSPQPINTEELYERFRSLSSFTIITLDWDHTVDIPEFASSSPERPPSIIDVNTEHEYLYGVTCLNDQEIWNCGNNNVMKLHNLKGDLLKSIQTDSSNVPSDIAVTRSGYLVYTDFRERTVNIVKNTSIQRIDKMLGWRPLNVCSSNSGGILVVMTSNNRFETKVVCYHSTGSALKRCNAIQFDEKGRPLYSSGHFGDIKYINESKNLDICVADIGAHAVVVVNHAGNFRFRYTVHASTPMEPFQPVGIATDSRSRILTADFNHHRIHILDQDGQFLHFIDSCDLYYPWGLCVDTHDNVFVAVHAYRGGKIKKIQTFM